MWFEEGRRLRQRVHAAGNAPGLPLVVRTFGGMSALVLVANIIGGLVVGLLLVALNADATGHQRLVIGIGGAAYGVAALVFGAVMGFVLQGRTLRWLAFTRVPTR